MLNIKTTEDTKERKKYLDQSFCENLSFLLLKIKVNRWRKRKSVKSVKSDVKYKNNRKRRGYFVVSLFYCIFAAIIILRVFEMLTPLFVREDEGRLCYVLTSD